MSARSLISVCTRMNLDKNKSKSSLGHRGTQTNAMSEHLCITLLLLLLVPHIWRHLSAGQLWLFCNQQALMTPLTQIWRPWTHRGNDRVLHQTTETFFWFTLPHRIRQQQIIRAFMDSPLPSGTLAVDSRSCNCLFFYARDTLPRFSRFF